MENKLLAIIMWGTLSGLLLVPLSGGTYRRVRRVLVQAHVRVPFIVMLIGAAVASVVMGVALLGPGYLFGFWPRGGEVPIFVVAVLSGAAISRALVGSRRGA